MKIVIAFDSFKGTLDAAQACKIVADALLAFDPGIRTLSKPVADGGEGTASALICAANGRWIPARVTGPLPNMSIDAGFAWFEDTRTALVEMASASGITLLKTHQFDPLRTTTFGTGELIRAACEMRPDKILLAVGGSATVDGGTGAAAALGWKFFDKSNKILSPCGGELSSIAKIVPPNGLNLPPIEVLCDVDSPLTGLSGSAHVFGPQKGATPQMVLELDKGLGNLARIVRTQFGKEIETVAGSGAAGGLAAGAIAFMNAALIPGIDTVIKASNLSAAIEDADWLITGEGSFDAQSLRGKVVAGVAKTAMKKGVRVVVLAGQVKLAPAQYLPCGIVDAFACRKPEMTLDYALDHAPQLLADAAAEFAARYLGDNKH